MCRRKRSRMSKPQKVRRRAEIGEIQLVLAIIGKRDRRNLTGRGAALMRMAVAPPD